MEDGNLARSRLIRSSPTRRNAFKGLPGTALISQAEHPTQSRNNPISAS